MPDGPDLATDLYLPAREGKYPVILIRTPYSSKQLSDTGETFTKADYAVVIQNVRGRNGSSGNFLPFASEMNDGMATLDWINKQPWSNGKVGLWGGSYLGYCAFLVASSGHPSIGAGVNISGWADLKHMMRTGGATRIGDFLPWILSQMRGPIPPQGEMDKIFRIVPLKSFFRGMDEKVEQAAGKGFAFERVRAPFLHITGWYDYLYDDTLYAYEGIRTRSEKPPMQQLVIGTWAHNGVFADSTKIGDEDFGAESPMGKRKLYESSIRWFDYHLKGIKNGIQKDPLVKYFLMGENQWHETKNWVPTGVKYENWYLMSGGNANTLNGDGKLSRKPPRPKSVNAFDFPHPEAVDNFVFDPNNPVPTLGGANSNFLPYLIGTKNQQDIEKRKDVLVYTSPAFKQGPTIVGRLQAVIYAATEGKDTDFTAKLVEVRTDGYARMIEEGILRGRVLAASKGATGYLSGRVYEFRIDLGATAIRLRPGSRLRLEISSSNFPKYDRNPNTGEDPLTATTFQSVRQTIFHSKEFASYVRIPIQH